MTLEQLKEKYKNIPNEMRQVNRWICYDIVKDAITGEEKKVPKCAFNGGFARSNDNSTWTNFYVACLGCEKFNFYGLGFMLGDGFFGIDLDNHVDKVTGKKAMSEDEFFDFSKEFLDKLDTYAEYSHSGAGIHIICKGTLPAGARRKVGSPVEMYDRGRFFTMTGLVIKNSNVNDCTETVIPLHEKYLKKDLVTIQPKITTDYTHINEDGSIHFGETGIVEHTLDSIHNTMSDSDLIQKISVSKNGKEFNALYNGDMSSCGNDHSMADYTLCQILAFWTNKDMAQMDRIFRSSQLMRDKWDSTRGDTTYGVQTMTLAISRQLDTFKPKAERIGTRLISTISSAIKQKAIVPTQNNEFSLDEYGDPIINEVKKTFKNYDPTDTGNAERFYDYFGKNFKYNKTNQCYMVWNGKKWMVDSKEYVKKYADKLIDILKQEGKELLREIDADIKNGVDPKTDEELLEKQNRAKLLWRNIDRISNAAGKNAMLEELQHLHHMPTTNDEFDNDDFLLNTDSGVVDLKQNKLIASEKNMMFSKSTNCAINTEEPKLWLKFLHEVFERRNKEETEEIIHCLQKVLGYSLSGSTREQFFCILYGATGANGKSVLMNTILRIFGEYADTIDSDLIMSKPTTTSQAVEFSLASLVGLRLVSCSETSEGQKMDEKVIKSITGGERIRAQQKYGQPFSFLPKFKVFLLTNHLPRISAGYAIWRRIMIFPFLNTFTEEKRDVHLEEKLMKEKEQILNWIIDGYKLYQEEGIEKPKCMESSLSDYKQSLDTLQRYLNNETEIISGYQTKARELYSDYKNWCKDNNEFMLSESKFANQLEEKGFKKKRTGNGFVYIGLKLSSDEVGHNFTYDE